MTHETQMLLNSAEQVTDDDPASRLPEFALYISQPNQGSLDGKSITEGIAWRIG